MPQNISAAFFIILIYSVFIILIYSVFIILIYSVRTFIQSNLIQNSSI